jgi:hypothetical protein
MEPPCRFDDDDDAVAGCDRTNATTTTDGQRRSEDPPEVMLFELPDVRHPSSSRILPYSHSSHGRMARCGAVADDDGYVDEYEMEGLVATTARSSSPGAPLGGVGGGIIDRVVAMLGRWIPTNGPLGAFRIGSLDGSSSRSADAYYGAAPLLLSRRCRSDLGSLCSLGWEPHNRARTAISLLFASLLCTIILAEYDVAAWHRSIFGRDANKGAMGDPSLVGLTEGQRQYLLKSLYGSYNFYDGSAEDRPTTNYMTEENAGNPYLDLAESKFPLESWQADAVYANHFLDAAEKLVKRGMEAIFATYHGLGLSDVRVVTNDDDDEDGGGGGGERVEYVRDDPDQRSSRRSSMFHVAEVDLDVVASLDELRSAAPSWENKGGWTTERSLDGLERRLMHAVMTRSELYNGNFTVVFAGSWQSLGYGGNHAWQSAAGVFETLLKGLFQRLGLNLVVRAIGLPPPTHLSAEERTELDDGGKSTFVHALGWSSIYGSDVDMVVWDDYGADEDEGSDRALDELSAQMFDLFARQALLSGTTTLPFIWGGDFDVLRNLHNHADADVGQLGTALAGVPETTSEIAASDLPWASWYLNCPRDMKDTCQEDDHQFESRCWIDRSDVSPPTPQLDRIPVIPSAIGWRMQKLKGYTLAYVLLTATLNALFEFSEITISAGFPLPDEHW